MNDTQQRVRLTPGQDRIVRLYITGLPAKHIAQVLGIQTMTVRGIIRDARRRFKDAGFRVENRIHLAKSYAIEYGDNNE